MLISLTHFFLCSVSRSPRCTCGNAAPEKFLRYFNKLACNASESGKHTHPRDSFCPGEELLGLQCQKCSTEWLRKEFLVKNEADTRGPHMNLAGVILKKRTQMTYTPCSCCPNTVPIHFIVKLKPGDHICWHRTYFIWHHAVIIEVDLNNTSWVKVSEFASPQDGSSVKGERLIHWINLKDENGQLYLKNYSKEVEKLNPAALVVARAYARRGEHGYNLAMRNCEHHSTFCKTGTPQSQQVSTAVQSVSSKIKQAIFQVAKIVGKELSETTGVKVLAEVGIAETAETVMSGTNAMGAGLVVAIEGVWVVIDVKNLYNERMKGSISRNDFIERTTNRILKGLVAAGIGVGVSMVVSYFAPGFLDTLVGTVVIGGVVAGVGVLATHCLGETMKSRGILNEILMLEYDDFVIKSIDDLEAGDQIVIWGNWTHPRCHAIVTQVISRYGIIWVIRNTYANGVVRETLKFKDLGNVCKVAYPKYHCYDKDEVVRRANRVLERGQYRYHILTYNCKTFARECKVERLKTKNEMKLARKLPGGA